MLKSPIRPAGVVAIILAFIVSFGLSFTNVMTRGGADAIRCDYDGDYDCQNEAEEKYQGPDGKYYCEIHWEELYGN